MITSKQKIEKVRQKKAEYAEMRAQLWAIVIDPEAAAADKTEASRLVMQIDQMRYSDYENCNWEHPAGIGNGSPVGMLSG